MTGQLLHYGYENMESIEEELTTKDFAEILQDWTKLKKLQYKTETLLWGTKELELILHVYF